MVPSALLTAATATQLGLGGQVAVEVVQVQPAVIGDQDVAQLRADLPGQLLPRNDVGVVLELGGDHHVARTQVRPAPRVGDQVDGLGRVAHEHDLALARGVEEPGDLAPGRLEALGRVLAQLVDAAVDVGVVVRVRVLAWRRSRPAAWARTRPSRDRRGGCRCRSGARRPGSRPACRCR